MHLSRRMRLLALILLPVLAVAATGGAFIITREVAPDGSARADTPFLAPTPGGNATPEAFVEAQATRAAQPRFDQTLNGIRVGPAAARQVTPCLDLKDPKDSFDRPYQQIRSDAVTAGLAIEPNYLPSATTNASDRDLGVYCHGVLAIAGREYIVPADPSTGRYGGYISIQRSVGPPQAMVDLPAQDFSAATIAGRPAVVARPTTPKGFGPSAAVVAGDGVVTVIYASGITESDLRKVAEGLF